MPVVSTCRRAVVVVLLAAAGAQASEQAADPALEVLAAEVFERNPDLRALEAELEALRQRPVQARALPDPMLALTWVNDGWSPSVGRRDMSTLGVMWSQELPRGGRRALAAQDATLEAAQGEQALARKRRELRASAERAYAALLLSRERLALAREQGDAWRQIEGVARARYAVGLSAQQDVLRAQVELTRIEQLQARQAAEAEIALAEVNRLRDQALDAPFETSARLGLTPAPADEASLLDELRAHSPELQTARLQVEREATAVLLAERLRQPDLSVQAGYMHRGALDPMWQAGVGLRLPLRRAAQRGALAEAQARRQAARLRLASQELQLRFRTRARLARLQALTRQARLYGEGIVPQDRMSMEAALANYQAGKVPFLAVLEALTALYDDRGAQLELLADHAMPRAALHEALLEGVEP